MSFRKTVVITAAAAMIAVAAPSPTFAQTSTPQTSVDKSLEDRIEAIFDKDAELDGYGIDIDVAGAIVTLKGKVRTDAEKARAERIAKIGGVTSIQNDLVVDAKAPKGKIERAADATKTGTDKAIDATAGAAKKTTDKTKEVAGKTAEKSKEGAGVAKDAGKDIGQKTKEAAATTGEAVTDAAITTKVKAKFIDETVLKGSEINVDTNDHVVTLKGTVASAAGKARAEEIARTTDGVKRVVNQIVVKP